MRFMIGRNGKTAQICEQTMTSMRKNDPLARDIELALCPGCYIRYDDMSDFARDLDQVQSKIEALVAGGEATRAVGL